MLVDVATQLWHEWTCTMNSSRTAIGFCGISIISADAFIVLRAILVLLKGNKNATVPIMAYSIYVYCFKCSLLSILMIALSEDPLLLLRRSERCSQIPKWDWQRRGNASQLC